MGNSPVEVAGRARVLGEIAALYSSLTSDQQQSCPRSHARTQKFSRRRNHGGVGTFVCVRHLPLVWCGYEPENKITAEDGVYPVRVFAWRWRAWRAVTRPARPSCIAAGNVRLTP